MERTDEDYALRMHSNRIYYVRESLMRRATNVSDPYFRGKACLSWFAGILTLCVTLWHISAGISG